MSTDNQVPHNASQKKKTPSQKQQKPALWACFEIRLRAF